MLNQVPIDGAILTGRFLEAEPAQFQGQQQERDGSPVWNVTLLVKPEGAQRTETVVVKVTSKAKPEVEELARVRLVNPYATFWQQGDRSGLSIRADALVLLSEAIPQPKATAKPSASAAA